MQFYGILGLFSYFIKETRKCLFSSNRFYNAFLFFMIKCNSTAFWDISRSLKKIPCRRHVNICSIPLMDSLTFGVTCLRPNT